MLRKLKTTPMSCRMGDISLNWVIKAVNSGINAIEKNSDFT